MKNFAGIFGWVLLAAVLAVPSFLFYNWWTANKAKEAQLAASQQGVPRDFFPAPPADSQPLVTPDQAAATGDTAPQAVPDQAAATGDTAPQAVPDQAGATGDTAPNALPAADTRSAEAEPASVSSPTVAGTPETGSYFNPKTKRNPFLTPDDYARMRDEAERRRQEARDRARQASQKPREVLVETRLNIQGIVGTTVIINGEMYSRGDTVLGAKIVSIGTNYIIGEHKGRRFRKYMQ